MTVRSDLQIAVKNRRQVGLNQQPRSYDATMSTVAPPAKLSLVTVKSSAKKLRRKSQICFFHFFQPRWRQVETRSFDELDENVEKFFLLFLLQKKFDLKFLSAASIQNKY